MSSGACITGRRKVKPSRRTPNQPTGTATAGMQFQFLPLRFEFRAAEPLYFPPGKAGNLLRGALGKTFNRIACVPECPSGSSLDTRPCLSRESCLYAQVFEPVATGPGPSGLSDAPRPFVFRARRLDGRTIQPDQLFDFDLHLFSLDPDVLKYFVRAFTALAHEGLGPQRGKAELQRVLRIAWHDLPEHILYQESTQLTTAPVEPATIDLAPVTPAPRKIRVDFLSPTELKRNTQIVSRPEFPILFGRIRDRISTLRALYGPGPLGIDFRSIGGRAAAVRMANCEVRRQEFERHSSRTGQTHSIGGFVGFAEYEGEMGEFLPYLEAARWVGVGRQVVWGKGEISIQLN